MKLLEEGQIDHQEMVGVNNEDIVHFRCGGGVGVGAYVMIDE
jgi:hypothetical protein